MTRGRFDGVKVVGVDERVWRRTRSGDKYVTVIVDLTPGMGQDRSLAAGASGIEVVAMDGFTGFKTEASGVWFRGYCATSRTAPPAHYQTPADSDTTHTPDRDEPSIPISYLVRAPWARMPQDNV